MDVRSGSGGGWRWVSRSRHFSRVIAQAAVSRGADEVRIGDGGEPLDEAVHVPGRRGDGIV